MGELAVEVKDLSYAFQGQKVLEQIHLALESDKIYGLLGKNGAGKTTLLNVLVNQLIAKQGEIRVFGKDPRKEEKILEQVCIVREAPIQSCVVKAKDIFKMYQAFYPHYDKDLEAKLTDFFELPLNQSYQKYSRGMKTLVANIIGICSRAPLTIFDEPTTGLDAVNREQFYQILLEDYGNCPRTMILSTHLIDELENVLERILILDSGKILLDEEVETLKAQSYYLSGRKEDLEALEALKGRQSKECFGKTQVYSYVGEFSVADQKRIKELEIEISPMGLQKAFVELTKGKEFRHE